MHAKGFVLSVKRQTLYLLKITCILVLFVVGVALVAFLFPSGITSIPSKLYYVSLCFGHTQKEASLV